MPLDGTNAEHELPVLEAQNRLPELVDVVQAGAFVYLTIRGTRVAALMPADVAENYEKIEDEYWARRASEVNETGTFSWEQAIADLEGGT